MRQASRMQRKIEEIKTKFRERTFETPGANGQIKVTVNGGGELTNVTIDPALLTAESLELVQDALVATVNAAVKEANKQMEAELEKATGGVKIPGLV